MIPTRVYSPSDRLYHVHFKVREVLLPSATAYFITKCDGLLLQSATILLQSATILLQSATILLQSSTGIKKLKYDDYYKVQQNIRQLIRVAFPAHVKWTIGLDN